MSVHPLQESLPLLLQLQVLCLQPVAAQPGLICGEKGKSIHMNVTTFTDILLMRMLQYNARKNFRVFAHHGRGNAALTHARVMALSGEQVEQFRRDGFLTVDNFLTALECDYLREKAAQIVSETDLSQHPTITFNTRDNAQSKSDYFLTSGDQIRFFFEEGAVDETGQLKVDPRYAMNKIGHALHALDPDFKKVTFSDGIKGIMKSLEMKRPAVVQSMVIFKQPNIGGAVNPHQDSTFLCTTPMNLIGVWIALEDANLDNACMWFIPGSHKAGVGQRMVRTLNGGVLGTRIYGDSLKTNPGDFVATPVRKGSLVLIHGDVIHKSEANLSDRSRNIYTFHLYDAGTSEWSKDNWLQPTETLPFPYLY